MTVTPSILTALLNTYAIGAGGPGGSGTIRDQSLDLDHSEVHIVGVYDLSEVANELNDLRPSNDRQEGVRQTETSPLILWAVIAGLVIIVVALMIVIGTMEID